MTDGIRGGDAVMLCPACGSRHYRNVGILRTDVLRDGGWAWWRRRSYVSIVTGSVNLCDRCGAEFSATNEGAVVRARGAVPLPGKPNDAPAAVPPSAPRPAVLMTPKARPVV